MFLKGLNEMIPFYSQTNDNVKLQEAKEQLSEVEAIAENIKILLKIVGTICGWSGDSPDFLSEMDCQNSES